MSTDQAYFTTSDLRTVEGVKLPEANLTKSENGDRISGAQYASAVQTGENSFVVVYDSAKIAARAARQKIRELLSD